MNQMEVEDFYKKIGKNVAKYRKERGLSQLDLSLQMNYKSISIVSSSEIYYKAKHFNLYRLRIGNYRVLFDICSLLK